jgi:hypothetical protein
MSSLCAQPGALKKPLIITVMTLNPDCQRQPVHISLNLGTTMWPKSCLPVRRTARFSEPYSCACSANPCIAWGMITHLPGQCSSRLLMRSHRLMGFLPASASDAVLQLKLSVRLYEQWSFTSLLSHQGVIGGPGIPALPQVLKYCD